MKKEIANLQPYDPGMSKEEIMQKYNLSRLAQMSANESTYGPSKKAIQAGENFDFNLLGYYPDSYVNQLRTAVSNLLNVEKKSLVFGNGLDEIIELLSRAILNPADEVIIPEPTFSEYEINAAVENAKIVKVNCDLSGMINLDLIQTQITKQTKMIWICNPNNPTGTKLTAKEIETFLAKVPKEITVVVDEAYIDFIKDGQEPIDLIEQTKKYNNLVVIRTLSKAYGLANLRIGFAVCNGEILKALQAIRPPYNINSISEIIATEAVLDQDYLKSVIQKNATERTKLENYFQIKGIKYLPSDTNFVFFEFKEDKKLAQFLLENGYQIRTGLQKNGLRASIGKPSDNQLLTSLIDQFMK